MRRWRVRAGPLNSAERRELLNHPNQGSAADILRHVVVRLGPLLRQQGARIATVLYDSLLIEAPAPIVAEIGALAERVMKEEMKRLFPVLEPRVDVSLEQPDRWGTDV